MISRVGVAILAGATVLVALIYVVLISLPRTTPLSDVYGLRGIANLTGLVLGSLGAAIALRQPRNPVGWMFLVSGLCISVLEPASEYASYSLVERGGSLPGAAWVLWLSQVVFVIAFGPLVTFLPLIFPDGRLPSPRWRPVGWYTAFALVAFAAASALLFQSVGIFVSLPNPVSTPLAVIPETDLLTPMAQVLIGPAAILCVAAFIRRFVDARGDERQQLKWVVFAIAIAVSAIALLPASSGRKPLEIVKQLALLAPPVAAGIAVLRYRLYDIDLLIKGTLVYGFLSVVLGFTYVVSILATEDLLGGLAGGSDIAVAGSTLLVVALFQPFRKRVQSIVDRRFYRSRYDAVRTFETFSARLGDDVDLDSVRADLLGVIWDTIHPAHASVWLRRH